ncbi:myoneurin-like isoform X4 [Plodia interpunctella]|uniref:myoneurin-like isoform X4 n=1 Tax=Plodia interpunctella TaxID=58824 RepID=UPI0023689B1E|nr:myoneurin-like isoform X4 [Plodia interpunctella]
MAESSEHWKIEKGLCRCCHSEGSFHQLSDICIVGEEEGFYADMLQLTLNISMKPVEKPLNMICDNCVHRVKDATAFKQQVLRCEAQFHEMYTKGVIKVGLTSVVKEEPESDGNDDSKMDAGGFEDNDEANTDVADSQSEPLAEVGLELCKKEPLTEDTDNRRKSLRTKKATSILEISLLTPKQQKPKQKPKPSKKLKKTKDASAAEDSTSKDTIVTVNTEVGSCRSDITSKSGEEDDLPEPKGKIKVEAIILCPICKIPFNKRRIMRIHLFSSHGLEEIMINRKYVTRTPEEVTCDICQKVIATKAKFNEHFKKIHKRTKCTKCPAMLLYSEKLRHMMKTHGDGLVITCGLCDYKSISKSRIAKHQRQVHMKEKNAQCLECGAKFFDDVCLKKHMVSHNPIKTYECTYCKKKFARSSTLNIHRAIHTGEKKKECQICGERFVQKASLNYHMVKHHPEAC